MPRELPYHTSQRRGHDQLHRRSSRVSSPVFWSFHQCCRCPSGRSHQFLRLFQRISHLDDGLATLLPSHPSTAPPSRLPASTRGWSGLYFFASAARNSALTSAKHSSPAF